MTDRLHYVEATEVKNEKIKEISWIQSHFVRAPLVRILALLPMVKDLNEPSAEHEKIFNYLRVSAGELDEMIKDIADTAEIVNYRLLSK